MRLGNTFRRKCDRIVVHRWIDQAENFGQISNKISDDGNGSTSDGLLYTLADHSNHCIRGEDRKRFRTE
jgi:hypothetical protein